MYDHHWQGGLPPEPDTHFGFVYEIHHLPSGKKYIGKKQYWFRAPGGPKQADTDIRGKKWKAHHWKPSDWRTYTGSPTDKDLKRQLKCNRQEFEFSIIQQCVSKRDLSFAEPAQMHRRGVGTLRDSDGELVYLNRHIPECYGATSEWYTKGIQQTLEHRQRHAASKSLDPNAPCRQCGDTNWKEQKQSGGRGFKPSRRCRTCDAQKQAARRDKDREKYNTYMNNWRAKKKGDTIC